MIRTPDCIPVLRLMKDQTSLVESDGLADNLLVLSKADDLDVLYEVWNFQTCRKALGVGTIRQRGDCCPKWTGPFRIRVFVEMRYHYLYGFGHQHPEMRAISP